MLIEEPLHITADRVLDDLLCLLDPKRSTLARVVESIANKYPLLVAEYPAKDVERHGQSCVKSRGFRRSSPLSRISQSNTAQSEQDHGDHDHSRHPCLMTTNETIDSIGNAGRTRQDGVARQIPR